jgi:P-type Mg2+ transporter
MALAVVGITAIGAVLPYTGHMAHIVGFRPMPGRFFPALAGIVVVYLVLAEAREHWFYRPDHDPGV